LGLRLGTEEADKMRVYTIIRTGASSVKFIEQTSQRAIMDNQFKRTAIIKSNIPYSFDPMLLFLHLTSQDKIKELSVHDCDGYRWFHVESDIPLTEVAQSCWQTTNVMK
jgi:hypothetical protein